tara:strand:+ start:244 stop:495 length:252 start_codon:yes stop_codon:yes gene_type:complete
MHIILPIILFVLSLKSTSRFKHSSQKGCHIIHCVRFNEKKKMAGVPGFEPGMAIPKTAALPLGHTPTLNSIKMVPQPRFELGT